MKVKGKEQFKDVKGYEGLYEVSNHGRVFSHYGKGKILSSCKTSSGYKLVNLVKDGIKKDVNVHRLVANAFIDNPLGKRCVNHIDGNKTNN
ncbi:NUMOD4 domain-containing protein [Companilactobacillus sp.]|uniref:NUMOD4 domain-containing protein n=1 Tax=Companilactobacillus sp. TaxID=2767905 RepID=UPI003451AECB